MKTESAQLKAIASEVRTALLKCQQLTILVAKKIYEAKGLCENTLIWLEWCKTEVAIQRRQAFMYARVGAWLPEAEPVLRKFGLLAHGDSENSAPWRTIDTHELEVLSCIPVSRLSVFLKQYDIKDMDRDELRAAVNDFLGRKSKQEQLDFFAQLKLPPPERVHHMLSLKDANFDVEKAASYGSAFLNAAIARRAQLPEGERKILVDNICHMLSEVTEVNVAAIIKQLGKG